MPMLPSPVNICWMRKPNCAGTKIVCSGTIELGVTEVLVIGHTDCGVQHIDSEMMIHHMKNRGISQESIDLMKYCGIDFVKMARRL